jgi:hypothetical protein
LYQDWPQTGDGRLMRVFIRGCCRCTLLKECALPLDDQPTGCGSSGSNGVHTYKISRAQPEAEEVEEVAGEQAGATKKKKKKKKKKGSKKTE